MAAQSFDDIASVVNTWRVEIDAPALPARVACASLPVDVWAENYAHVALAREEAAMAREFREWLETQP